MNPRLNSSKTWTEFPSEFLDQVQDLVTETFEDHLIEGASLHMEGRIYQEEILFRLGIKTEGQLTQNNFECSAQYNPTSQNAKKVMHHCIEASAAMMAEFFELEEDADFPREWAPFNFEGTPLFMQYTTINTELEAEADRLLGSIDTSLVHSSESQDALDFTVEEKIKVEDEDSIDEEESYYDADDDDLDDGNYSQSVKA